MGDRRPTGGRVAAALAGVLCCLAVAAPTAAADRRDEFVTSFDGTRIWAHFFPGEGASASDPFASKGPAGLVRRIKAPTLLIQGTVDTLFTLQESIDNFRAMRKNRRKVKRRRHGRAAKRRKPVPLKMIWFCGGHGVCRTDAGPEEYVSDRTLAWFDRHLRRESGVRTGPRFAWVDEGGTWRDSAEFPMRRVGALRASGAGTWPLVPGAAGGGALIFATPAPDAFKVPIPGPQRGADIVGVPRLRVAYTGTGAPPRTHAYAQIVDPRRNVVVGNVPTPVPLRLDGERHVLELPLEPIASRAPAGGGYELQITSSTIVYDIQRSVGLIDFENVRVELPVTKPIR